MPVHAQSEQFIPVLVYRTGVYAVSGVPFADGEVDYYKLINEKDGGIRIKSPRYPCFDVRFG